MELPRSVGERFYSLKRQYNFCITLKRINNGFYVYKATTKWDSDLKKARSITEYLGRITPDGKFITKLGTGIQTQANYGLQHQNGVERLTGPLITNDVDEKLLTILSTNAKANLSFFGRKIGLTPSETYNRVRVIEKKYGIRYLAEISSEASREKHGFNYHVILIKFDDRVPSNEEVRAVAQSQPSVQLAMRLNGPYDFLFYLITHGNRELTLVRRALRTALGRYDSSWSIKQVNKQFNFVPVREDYLDAHKDRYLKREYAVLKELNKNGTADFTEIDKMYGFDDGRSLYSYHKLLENGMITRITLSMDKLPIKYVGLIFEEIRNYGKYLKARMPYGFYDIISNNPEGINKYSLVCNIEDPHGAIFFLPVFKEGDLQRAVETIEAKKAGVKLSTAIVTETLLGSMCFRRIDMQHTGQYEQILKDFKINDNEKVDYNQTGRAKKRHIKINKELGVWGMLGNGEALRSDAVDA